MTRTILMLCSVLGLLCGCASGGRAPALFVLDDGDPGAAATPASDAPALIVEPVRTAAFLDQGGIVYQTAAHRVVIANNNRWASPLTAQLSDIMTSTLAARLPGIAVRGPGPGTPGDAARLRLRVDRFMGHYDGQAHIAGHWQLLNAEDKPLAAGDFRRLAALDDDGYPALVASLSRGWRAVAAAIAPKLAIALKR